MAIVLAVCAMAVERIGVKMSRAQRRAYWERRKGKQAGFRREFQSVPPKGITERGALNAADQLRKVMKAQFASRALLNRPEAAVFKALDTAVIARNDGAVRLIGLSAAPGVAGRKGRARTFPHGADRTSGNATAPKK